MTRFAPNPRYAIADEQALRSMFPPTHDIAIKKCRNALGEHARAFIERCPFVCIGTQNHDGRADVSPRGDPAGFVTILDDQTLAIPDRPGNNRLDTLANILENPAIGLLFIIPGFDETLRVNGTASLTTDPDILQPMTVNHRTPTLAIVVSINEVFLHCAKAFRRSRLWDPEHFQDRAGMPSLIKMILDETTGAPEDRREQKTLDDDLEQAYRTTLY